MKDKSPKFVTMIFSAAMLLLFVASCAKTSRIHSGSGIPVGYHQVTEVVYLASKEEIMQTPEAYDVLRLAGIANEDIRNGSIVFGRVFCCGGEGTAETESLAVVYFPPDLSAEKGDIVEFIAGRVPEGEDPGSLNTGISIRNKNGIASEECRYVPENPKLWMRVIHCDWMTEEGWQKQGGLNPIWYKPVGP